MQNTLSISNRDASAAMECRSCGACCVAISITSPIPGMPNGKPAGVRCIHLNYDDRCNLFGKTERPLICNQFQATSDFCGESKEEAYQLITTIELLTRPVLNN